MQPGLLKFHLLSGGEGWLLVGCRRLKTKIDKRRLSLRGVLIISTAGERDDGIFFGQQSDCRMEDNTDSTWHLATFQRPSLRMDVRKESDV